jgi:hypothetical protein
MPTEFWRECFLKRALQSWRWHDTVQFEKKKTLRGHVQFSSSSGSGYTAATAYGSLGLGSAYDDLHLLCICTQCVIVVDLLRKFQHYLFLCSLDFRFPPRC